MKVHAIPPGLYCVPAAIVAITGADVESVVWPALNRHSESDWLTGPVAAIGMSAAERVLNELGYVVRGYRHEHRQRLHTWAEWSRNKYAGRILLLATHDHAMVAKDGMVYDTARPYGVPGWQHPDAKCIVVYAKLVEARA